MTTQTETTTTKRAAKPAKSPAKRPAKTAAKQTAAKPAATTTRRAFDDISDEQSKQLAKVTKTARDAVAAFEQHVISLIESNVSPTQIGREVGLASSAVMNIIERRDAGKTRANFTTQLPAS